MQKDIKMGMMAGTIIAIISFIIFSIIKPSNDSSVIQSRDGSNLDKYQQTPVEKTQIVKDDYPVLTTTIPIQPRQITPTTRASSQEPTRPVSDNQTHRNLNVTAPLEKHTVTRGETLSSISMYYYGDATHWNDILEANRNILNNPNNLRPGMQLVIPR